MDTMQRTYFKKNIRVIIIGPSKIRKKQYEKIREINFRSKLLKSELSEQEKGRFGFLLSETLLFKDFTS